MQVLAYVRCDAEATLTVADHKIVNLTEVYSVTRPAAGDRRDLTERQFQKDLFLIVDDVDSCPVDSNDHLILWEAWPGELVRLVEAGEQEWPLVLGVVDDVFLDGQRLHSLLDEIAPTKCI